MTTLYQRRTLSTGQDVGRPGPLPANLDGLADATLADLPSRLDAAACRELGYLDTGFFPVEPEPPAPPRVRWVHKAIYLRRFTPQERIAIKAARAGDATLDDLLYVMEAAENIFLDDPDLSAGLGYLVSQGLLGAGRPAEILA